MPEMIVRLKRGKKTFEVLVNEGLLPQFRAGKLLASDVVATPTIFTDISKGAKASKEQVQTAFATADVTEALKEILQKGDAQQSSTERKEIADTKRQQVITQLTKTYVGNDGLPIPPGRFENALVQIRARIDQVQPASRQVDLLAPKLMTVLPMKRAAPCMEAVITLPAAFGGVAATTIRKHAKVQRVVYAADIKFEVEVIAYDALLRDLERITENDFEFVVVTPAMEPTVQEEDVAVVEISGKGKKKKKKKNVKKLEK